MHDKNETVNTVNRNDDNERLCKLSVILMKQGNKFYIVSMINFDDYTNENKKKTQF